MPLSERENYLRVAQFQGGEWIPMVFHINPACWNAYSRSALEDLMGSHPLLFPKFESGAEQIVPTSDLTAIAAEPYTDPWGCLWRTTEDGIVGQVTRHPLSDWEEFESLPVPDPNCDFGRGPIDWAQEEKRIEDSKDRGILTSGGLRHGHTFMTLCDIRGYENLLADMADGEPRLFDLIRIVEDFNRAIVDRYVQMNVDVMAYPEDLGMQVGPMISPRFFKTYIKPSYQRLIAPARETGRLIHMHSDGDIRTLAEDLIEGGVRILNLQDRVNGIDWIRDNLAGRICIDLDIDRQRITAFGTPSEIDSLIREEVEKLGSRRGGLTMIYGLYPGVPLDNVKALMDAMERYAAYYS
jgi:uroporphyrinogen decarboxylase